jgi:hypothetical protein
MLKDKTGKYEVKNCIVLNNAHSGITNTNGGENLRHKIIQHTKSFTPMNKIE